MKFSEWQLGRIRTALTLYRAREASNGRILSVATLLHQILMAPVTRHNYPKSGEEPEFREESLRRFLKAQSTLELHKLEDLVKFLVSKKMIAPNDLAEDTRDSEEINSVTRYLANDDDDAKILLASLREEISTKRQLAHTSEEVKLSIALDPSGLFVRVVERYSRLRKHSFQEMPGIKNSRDDTETETRRGYGFVITKLNLLCLFLRGASSRNTINYQQLRNQRDLSGFSSLLLLRIGDDPGRDQDKSPRALLIERLDFLPGYKEMTFEFPHAWKPNVSLAAVAEASDEGYVHE